jgi:glycosyltransferase involved in cell wall biosynthesis
MSRQLRILVAHQVAAERTGGMSRLMGFVHDQLVSHGHHVDYFTADDVPLKWRNGAGRRFRFPFLVRQAVRAAADKKRPYDVVNVHEPHALPMTMGRASTGSPSVFVTSHGLERRAWALANEEARLGRRSIPLKTRLTYPPTSLWPGSLGLRRADHLFCLNSEDRSYLVQAFGRAPETITRIYPGADPIYAGTLREYDRATRILFAAAWRDNKGIADLVPAFVRLADRHPFLTLTIVGAGLPGQMIRSQFPRPIHSRIMVESPAGERATAEAFGSTDLFLLPSLFEGTPLTLIQAMMSGLPIVTTNVCGMKDVIEDGKTGLLTPVRSPDAIVAAIERLIGDRPLRERLGRLAQSTALQAYTWELVAQPVEEAYLRVCGGAVR